MDFYVKFDKELIDEVEEITDVDYERKEDMLLVDNVISMIKDLIYEIHKRDEMINDIKEEIEEKYELRQIDPYEEYGISERNFI